VSLQFSPNPTIGEIFRARVFDEPLVPIGAEPTLADNAALVAALVSYSERSSPDEFSSLTGFVEANPKSPWNAALLLNLGIEYYNTGHFSKTIDVWRQAWEAAKEATDPNGKAVADRSVSELASMCARLGQMTQLDELLKSVEHRVVSGPATEGLTRAREGLHSMRTHPEVSFRCGPLALHRIKLRIDPRGPGTEFVHAAASTQRGFSLVQVAELSRKLGLDFQMAYRQEGTPFIVPCVAHLKANHYTAMIQQEGSRYLLQDPTFGNDTWATREALESEASGYFLVPAGQLPDGWREVPAQEGETVWGKGNVGGPDQGQTGPCDPTARGSDQCPQPDPPCQGMARPRVHLLVVSLNINDEPIGYTPPLGPSIAFMVRYNQRDAFQPANFAYSNLGPKWTFDWLSYITDNPASPSANVQYYIMGGGTRTFTGFDGTTNSYEFQLYDQTQLTRTAPAAYEMLSPDGTKKVFEQSDGSTGTSRKVFLTEFIDPAGNAVSLTYDGDLRIVRITDAIGQVTTLSYGDPADPFKVTKITDPFGRFATFAYDASGRLISITDVIGITSTFTYDSGDFITALTTPYGTTTFTKTESGTTRALETLYPDGNRERVEFNQGTSFPASDPPQSVPLGMSTANEYLNFRDTFYWDKKACAVAYGDYTKARLYHWLHTTDTTVASGILESTKQPLEGRVWMDYAGQLSGPTGPLIVGSTNKPAHVGRVLDDGSTQIYSYEYNVFGNVTKTIDPLGRTFSYIYADNGIDLLEVCQTRAGQNELLSQTAYNTQHLPLTVKDASGQVTTYTYNARGQVLTVTNPLGETTTHHYDANGYCTSIVGPLGDTITWAYDALGRVQTETDVSGYTLTYSYDALDRVAKITYPDGTFNQYTYTQLDRTGLQDRAGRQTSYQYDNVQQLTKQIDPLNRTTYYQWCKCGALRALTDPLGRTTSWGHDVQGRVKSKKYADGSKVTYLYESTTSRLRQRIDEKLQVTQYNYYRDNTLNGRSYTNCAVPTPPVALTYDPSYNRLSTMTDGIGTTHYRYIPITPTPTLGAGLLASVDGPLPNSSISYGYDALGRRVSTAVSGVASSWSYDAIGRVTSVTNVLGTFDYAYDGYSKRFLSQNYPNGQKTQYQYGSIAQGLLLQRITNSLSAGTTATNLSDFVYGSSLSTRQITTWSRQLGAATPTIYGFTYDPVDELTTATLSQGASVQHTYGYNYDQASNRTSEQIDGATTHFFYNALNELTSSDSNVATEVTCAWDAEQRLVGFNSGNQNIEFTYDGLGRRLGIRQLVGGTEVSNLQFLWWDSEICEERTASGSVSKRFFQEGVQLIGVPAASSLFYTRDHLGSIRELVDSTGAIRCRYDYDPYGRMTKLSGDLDSDFGFTGMFWLAEASLNLTQFRAYDPTLERWLSRDPLSYADILEGPNLYAYVNNNPVNLTDPLGQSPWGDALRIWCLLVKLSKALSGVPTMPPKQPCPITAPDPCDSTPGPPGPPPPEPPTPPWLPPPEAPSFFPIIIGHPFGPPEPEA
jgi:RHS repeat-associated protein